MNKLIERLHHVPTPASPTPRELTKPSFIRIDALAGTSKHGAARDGIDPLVAGRAETAN